MIRTSKKRAGTQSKEYKITPKRLKWLAVKFLTRVDEVMDKAMNILKEI